MSDEKMTPEASAASGLGPAGADARGLDAIRARIPVGQFYACNDPETLTHTEPEEAIEQYLDDEASRDCDMVALIREWSPLSVTAYQPREVSDKEIEHWAESLLENLGEHWREYADPEENPLDLLPDDADAIMCEAVRSIVRRARVWACEEVGEVTLSAEEVEALMRDWRSDWFEAAAPPPGDRRALRDAGDGGDMSRTIHCCLSVRGALRWPKRELARMCKATTMADGRRPTPDQLRDHLLDELAQGHEVLPFGDPCEGWDWKTGCPGHERGTPGTDDRGER